MDIDTYLGYSTLVLEYHWIPTGYIIFGDQFFASAFQDAVVGQLSVRNLDKYNIIIILKDIIRDVVTATAHLLNT